MYNLKYAIDVTEDFLREILYSKRIYDKTIETCKMAKMLRKCK